MKEDLKPKAKAAVKSIASEESYTNGTPPLFPQKSKEEKLGL